MKMNLPSEEHLQNPNSPTPPLKPPLVPPPSTPAVSHSTVQLPIASYLQRLKRLAADAAALLREARAVEVDQQQQEEEASKAGSSAGSSNIGPDQRRQQQRRREWQLEEVRRFLFQQQRFRLPPSGRSNLPAGSVVDHPGGWAGLGWARTMAGLGYAWQRKGGGLGWARTMVGL